MKRYRKKAKIAMVFALTTTTTISNSMGSIAAKEESKVQEVNREDNKQEIEEEKTPIINGEDKKPEANEEGKELEADEEVKKQEVEEKEGTLKETVGEKDANTQAKTSDQQAEPYYYLSDLGYVANMSHTAWRQIVLDANIDGNTISLKKDGELMMFDKGIGAHATSTVVFDVSNYSQTHTRFLTYAGIESSQAGKGNGVVFTVSTSQDGNTWTEVYQSGVINGNNDTVLIDVDIAGARYLKLYAHDNGTNGNDHAVYGGTRILLPTYDTSTENLAGVLSKEDYDLIIREKVQESGHVITNEIQHLLLKREFVNRIGFYTLQRILKKDDDHLRAVSWLMNNKEVLEMYIMGGGVDTKGNYEQSMDVFTQLYTTKSQDFSDATNGNLWLKLAISLSLTHAQTVKLWTGNNTSVSDPLVRYEIYKNNFLNGRMAAGGNADVFKELPVELMRWVVNSLISDEEIDWLIDYALEKKAANRNHMDAYEYIEYTFDYNYDDPKFYDAANYDMWNQKYHIENLPGYGVAGNHRLWMVFEDGSVCGGLAKTYANLGQVFGRPSAVIGQPGHAAALAYSQNSEGLGIWSIQNDVSGWTESEKGERLPLGWGSRRDLNAEYAVSYIFLVQHALNHYDDYMRAHYYNLLAQSYAQEPEKQIEIYNQALQVQNYNLDAWYGLIHAYKQIDSKTSEDYYNLSVRIADALRFFPLPFVDVMNLIESKITDGNYLAIFDVLKMETLKQAAHATSADSLQPNECITMAKYLLGENQVELATFSFDGEKTNQIVMNAKYDNSAIRWEYSLDNWNTKAETSQHAITLTPEEVRRINPNDDIQISMVGTSTIYTIDIREQEVPNIYVNDLENQIKGAIVPLEFSEDNGATWTLYEDQRFTGDKTLKIRYRASGTTLQSDETECSFHEDVVDPTRKYIPLSNVSTYLYSSQNNDGEHAAANMLDGNIFTGWHTTFGGEELKYYSVQFQEAKVLSSIEYYGDGGNGKLKDIDIYTSMDGTTWELNTEIRNIPNTNEWKTFDLVKKTPAKYVMIHAIHTHGARPNDFVSGRMLNFFEDTTYQDVEAKDIQVSFSETNFTNQNVTATIQLPSGYTIVGDATHTFTENGTYTFRYQSLFGTEYTYDVSVDWINKEVPVLQVSYSIETPTDQPVTATLDVVNTNGKRITITNNQGSPTYVFHTNGTFTFEYVDEYGNIGSTTAEVHWMVAKKTPSTITIVDTLDKVYDGQEINDPINYTIEGGSAGAVSFVWYEKSGDTARSSVWTPLATKPVDAGMYGVKAVLASTDTHEGAESEIKAFTITPASSTIIINDDISKVYDGQQVTDPQNIVKTGSSGAVSFQWYQKEVHADGQEEWLPLTQAPQNVGTYGVKAILAADQNYVGEESTMQTFTITPAPSTITINDDISKVYDGQQVTDPQNIIKTGSSGAVSFQWYQKEVHTDGQEEWLPLAQAPQNAGTYGVKAILAADQNYVGQESAIQTFTINKASSTIAVLDDLNKAYDGQKIADPQNIAKTGSSGAISFQWYQKEVRDDGQENWILLDTAPTNVGTYKVNVRLEEDTNYVSIESEKEFTISQVEIQILLTEELSKPFDGSPIAMPEIRVITSTGAEIPCNVLTKWYKKENTVTRTTIWVELPSAPSEVGEYKVECIVEGTPNYKEMKMVKEFAINEKKESEESTPTIGESIMPSEKEEIQKISAETIEGVQTGDRTQVGLWTMFLGLSTSLLYFLKRKRKSIK